MIVHEHLSVDSYHLLVRLINDKIEVLENMSTDDFDIDYAPKDRDSDVYDLKDAKEELHRVYLGFEPIER